MRIALVSPYSWTYPGGVTRHIEALAEELMAGGHHVRVLAPFDPPGPLSTRLHRGAQPVPRELPEHVISLGRTVGFRSNGAVSNLSVFPYAVTTLRSVLAEGDFDVVHIHEPVAPVVSWDAMCVARGLPLVGTFHTYGTNAWSHNAAVAIGARRRMQHLHVRVAVSAAAAWTARRFFGGRYRIVPNGVALHEPLVPAPEPDGPLRIAFVGQAVERKGLPVLVRAFEAVRDHVPAELTLVGVDDEQLEHVLHDKRGVTALGRVDDDVKRAVLREADVLCAPSLGGESFGMVLTEAFAAGTPAVASRIAGYVDVIRDGRDGVLFPAGDATRLAETLRALALDRRSVATMGASAVEHAQRYAWPRVAGELVQAYEDAAAMPARQRPAQRVAIGLGMAGADGLPRARSHRPASLEPGPPVTLRRRAIGWVRRAAILGIFALMAWLTVLAFEHIGMDKVAKSLVDSSPSWVLGALGLMALSMVLRAVSWQAILRAALPDTRIRRRDALRGTAIGVLMSATLPARLGEPARALVAARRIGRPREILPAVLGTIVSQTLLNVLALVILGVVMLSTVSVFAGNQGALIAVAILPAAIVAALLAVPALLRSGLPARSELIAKWIRQARNAAIQVRSGLRVFRSPSLGSQAVVAQLSAWALQWVACYMLLLALGLEDAGLGAAAAVLFAVNVTAVLPATPSNLGVFQAACVAVLHGAYGVSTADALGYGIVLQAVEIAAAVIMGMPALLREGLTWKDVRLRAMHVSPVHLPALPSRKNDAADVEADPSTG